MPLYWSAQAAQHMSPKSINKTFAHFCTAIAEAAVTVSQRLAKAGQSQHLDGYKADDSGELHPVTQTVIIAGTTVQVPEVCLKSPQALQLESMEMEFDLTIDSATGALHNHIRLLKKATTVRVRLKLRSEDLPEGVELLRDKLNKQLSHQLSDLT